MKEQSLNCTILDEQGLEVSHQSFHFVHFTTEVLAEYMAWEERLLKESTELQKKNC
jgi:hypothetical protein